METSILGNAEDKYWDIVTMDPKYIRMLERRGWVAEGPADEWGAKRFKLPLRRISFLRKDVERKVPNNGKRFQKAS